jgi:hypothetical protein
MREVYSAYRRGNLVLILLGVLVCWVGQARAYNASVTIQSPTSGSTVSGTVAVTATFGPYSWWGRLLVDGNWIANTPPSTFSWDSTSVTNGAHSLTVQSFLRHGSRPVAADTITVTVNNSSTSTYFSTVPPQGILPSESWCAANIPSTAEYIPDNAVPNNQIPTALEIASFRSATSLSSSYANLVDGNYMGSTDMIMRWAACKWGIDENVVRGEVWGESAGYQAGLNGVGDWTNVESYCPPGSGFPGAWDGSECGQSYGLVQIKYRWQPETWPMIQANTAFNVDYRFANQRQCMNGDQQSLVGQTPSSGYPTYPNGTSDQMLWGCIGAWYDGSWYDSSAIGYIDWVEAQVALQQWLQL